MRFWAGLTWKQRVLDGLCILLCIAQIIFTAINYKNLPERIPTNYDFAGNVSGYSAKNTIFILLAIDCAVTASLCVLLRIRRLYKTINIPWTVPWGREGLVIRATKDFLCWCNLCVTAIFAYLCYCIVRPQNPGFFIWVPVIALIPLMVWYMVRLRGICKR